MCAKLAFREKPATGLQQAILNKEARLKALWPARLAPQMATLPPIDEVLRDIRRGAAPGGPSIGRAVSIEATAAGGSWVRITPDPTIRLRCRYLPFSRFSAPFSKVKM